MKEKELDDFIRYIKEQFDCDIFVENHNKYDIIIVTSHCFAC